MRAILAVAITATFVLVAFWNHATSGDARPNVAKSIDPIAMMSDSAEMPTQEFVGP
jgi:hypothetical protein